jgi:hypothetical protein
MEEIQTQLQQIPIPTLTPNQLHQLDLPIQDEETLQAVNQMGPLKTPGPDGFRQIFTKSTGTQ